MDLIVTLIMVIGISTYKIYSDKTGVNITTTVTSDIGVESEINIKQESLTVGKNLMLRKEPRAYHFILDEMGLK